MATMFARHPPDTAPARELAGPALAEALRDSRRRTLAWAADLSDEQWQVPHRPGINPIAWELAHLAWFAEFWVLRGPHRLGSDGLIHATHPARIAAPDDLFDSARLTHALRWQRPLPSRAQVLRMLAEQLEACLQGLPQPGAEADDTTLYFHRLALFHEDMHGEALLWLRSALGYPAPADPPLPLRLPPQTAAPPIALPAAEVWCGWPTAQRGFAFDNEMPGRRLQLPAFEIDAQVVTAGQFLRFVMAGGYAEAAHWPAEAREWLAATRPAHPARWRRAPDGAWQQRWFGEWLPLAPDLPVIHVNAFEAQAYCDWAGRRLPRACEWEHAALAAGERGFTWGGSVWEWTADAFSGYPGFAAGPYHDYSQPWFGNHRELRGGSFAAHPRLHHPRYRNFFVPSRSDIFAGFRTAR